jgi:ubiquinone/menaquinone biosynthesis C-methylase UbiE
MYTREARYYDDILSFKDYPAEVRKLVKIIEAQLGEGRLSLLDVACGTGKHLEHLRERYECEGIDLSPQMLEVARARIPDVPLHEGDMLTFDLGRMFDVVTCLFSSVACVKSIDNLYLAIARMAAHMKPGGMLIIEPWFPPEKWQQNTIHMATVDRSDLKIARVNTSWSEGRISIFDLHFLVGTAEKTEHFVEHHEMGLFTIEEMTAGFTQAGLTVTHDPKGLIGRGLYVGRA